ncbi:MAG: hypothetical protein WDA20_12860, partial [Desulfuromonadales bacterium]
LREEIAAVNWLLVHLSEELPPASPAALAVARGAAWREILALAQWQGADELVALLEEALPTLGPELPPDTRVK